jgi:hypothetical protein
MSLKPNPKKINIILNILKGAQFEFLPLTPFYIDTPLTLSLHFESLPTFLAHLVVSLYSTFTVSENSDQQLSLFILSSNR